VGADTMKHSDLIDMKMLREQKQQVNDEMIEALYNQYFFYLERHMNIREKVRAKHIFCNIAGIEPAQLLLDRWKEHFEHWFAFDYRNIQGKSMFDRFLRESNLKLTEPMLKVSALFLMTTLEPVIVTKCCTNNLLEVNNIFISQSEQVNSMKASFHDVHNGDLLFMRKVKSGFRMMMIGPYLKIDKQKISPVIKKIETDFETFQQEFPGRAFRTFLKMHAIEYFNLS
jgi:hypothetical protein